MPNSKHRIDEINKRLRVLLQGILLERKKNKYRKKDMAEDIGTTSVYLSRFLTNNRPATPEFIAGCCIAYGIDANYILGSSDSNEQKVSAKLNFATIS